MRLVIDLQALQTGSALRGIGRYSKSLAVAISHHKNVDELIILLNNQEIVHKGNDFLEQLQRELGKHKIIFFPAPSFLNINTSNNIIKIAEFIREQFIEALKPDVLITCSIFEYSLVTSVPKRQNRSYLNAVILYDLIPFSSPEKYGISKEWYFEKIKQLKNADIVLSISDYSLRDAIKRAELSLDVGINISAGCELNKSDALEKKSEKKISTDLLGQYVLYVGGFDKRKNVDKLIMAYADISSKIVKQHKLVLVGHIENFQKVEFEKVIKKSGLKKEHILFIDYVNDADLIELYKNCYLFVFPSAEEGLGLTPLEAMNMGAPVIASNRTSIPEIVGNAAALFDPDNIKEFSSLLEKSLRDDVFRKSLIEHSKHRVKAFSWKKSADLALNFITYRLDKQESNQPVIKYTKNSFLKTLAEFCVSQEDFVEASKLYVSSVEHLQVLFADGIISSIPEGFNMTISFDASVPNFTNYISPLVFSSGLCREQHFRMPLYTYWTHRLLEKPKFHRKQWEFVYICQSLYERGFIKEGISAIGFGVGKEPLVSYFASQGIKVLATDLDLGEAQKLGWVTTDQHSNTLWDLNKIELCEHQLFLNNATFRNVDMNHIPVDIGTFDFCWSSCAFEHLGSIRKGLDFVINSAKLLNPGGVAVHTTEYNLSSNDETIDNNPSLVIFRRRDIEQLILELTELGYKVEPIDFTAGDDELERYVDMPPYLTQEPHLRLKLDKYVSTSIGLIIQAPQ